MSGTREERRAALEYGRYGREVAREVAREGCGHLVSYVDPRVVRKGSACSPTRW